MRPSDLGQGQPLGPQGTWQLPAPGDWLRELAHSKFCLLQTVPLESDALMDNTQRVIIDIVNPQVSRVLARILGFFFIRRIYQSKSIDLARPRLTMQQYARQSIVKHDVSTVLSASWWTS